MRSLNIQNLCPIVWCNFFLFRLFGHLTEIVQIQTQFCFWSCNRGWSTQSSTGLKSTKPLAEAPTRVGHKTVEYSTRTPITDLHEILFFEINGIVSGPHGYYERLGSYFGLR